MASASSPLPTTTRRPPRPPVTARLATHLRATIKTPYSDIPLLICAFISGASDAAAFASWSTFLSMQTGNTVFLALGASQQPIDPPFAWLESLTSILSFVAGCFIFARLVASDGKDGRTRGALAGSFALQGLMFFLGAGLVQGGLIPIAVGRQQPTYANGTPARFRELIPVIPLACQAGGQVVSSRVLGFNEIPTTVLTSLYCDMMRDTKVFRAKNEKRNRRVLCILALLVGGIIGGWISRSSGGIGAVLWMGGGLKLAIAVSWCFWAGERKEEVESASS